jgi:hypothetical protein
MSASPFESQIDLYILPPLVFIFYLLFLLISNVFLHCPWLRLVMKSTLTFPSLSTRTSAYLLTKECCFLKADYYVVNAFSFVYIDEVW